MAVTRRPSKRRPSPGGAAKSPSPASDTAKGRASEAHAQKKRPAQGPARALGHEPARGSAPRLRLSKAEQAYRELRDRILGGDLAPGTAIDKLALCAKLGVSRFPVQAAINRLAFERLVTIAPQHGSFVAPMSPAAIREYQMIRRALECEIAEMAAPRLSKEDRAALAENVRLQQAAAEAGDVSAFYALDVAFHQLIARPLALAHAVDALEAARTHLERMRRMLLSPQGRLGQAFAEHRALAEAVATGDPAAARQAMRAHLDSAATAFEQIFRERPELFSA